MWHSLHFSLCQHHSRHLALPTLICTGDVGCGRFMGDWAIRSVFHLSFQPLPPTAHPQTCNSSYVTVFRDPEHVFHKPACLLPVAFSSAWFPLCYVTLPSSPTQPTSSGKPSLTTAMVTFSSSAPLSQLSLSISWYWCFLKVLYQLVWMSLQGRNPISLWGGEKTVLPSLNKLHFYSTKCFFTFIFPNIKVWHTY